MMPERPKETIDHTREIPDHTGRYMLDLREIDKTKQALTGGKAAGLGELCRIDDIRVPEGFCVTTEAYKAIIQNCASFNSALNRLDKLAADDYPAIRKIGAEIRSLIEETAIPVAIGDEVEKYLDRYGRQEAYAVRSSATAEDLPVASFAGQQDTSLNVAGKENIIRHISKCWASLFTDRAIIYRLQHNFSHRQVLMSVIVQKMVYPQAAGILFTADPVTSNRKTSAIDAGFGLGEGLVSGLVNADNYAVRDGRITDKKISAKKLAVWPLKDGGTAEQQVEPERQLLQVLSDGQILQLERIGRKIEAHFGCPQDIEWCLAGNRFYIVQSRPITTLYPVPGVNDGGNHIYISVGHQQMMTDAIRPLGLSLFQLTAFRPMYQAGGRLFVDVSPQMASPVSREALLDLMAEHDPLIKSALMTLVERGDFVTSLPDNEVKINAVRSSRGKSFNDIFLQIGNDPAIAAGLIKRNETSVATLKEAIREKSGTALFDFILEDIVQLKQVVFDPESMRVIMAAIDAAAWINTKMFEWLGEKNAADTLSQSVPGNITSAMGRDLLDLADAFRPYPDIVKFLEGSAGLAFPDGLLKFGGGQQARAAVCTFLAKYGMRCAGEIDITKTRWSEKPAMLIPIILSNIKNFGPGAGAHLFEQGRRAALKKEQELLNRLEQLPGGDQKAAEARQMISRLRNFIGYREYPKYALISRYFVYKQAIMNEAAQLEQAAVIMEKEDVFYLTFDEFCAAVKHRRIDRELINSRKEEHKRYEKLAPPRVITSDGEIVTGSYKKENLPAGALAGLPVSSGVAEGRARVILDMEDACLEAGDILVTSFTDPSWTPLFVAIKALVTEAGGLMTHGAVVAREYGLPAVVGVENATRLIKDGQRIRVHGTDGYIEML